MKNVLFATGLVILIGVATGLTDLSIIKIISIYFCKIFLKNKSKF